MNITHSIGLDVHKSSARFHIVDETDRLDAESLAELGLRDREELLKRFAYHCPLERFELQRYLSSSKILRKSLTNIIKHTATTVHTLFPEIDELGLDITQVRVRRLLREHPSPARIAALGLTELRGYVGNKAAELKQAAAHTFAIQAMSVTCEEGLLGQLIDTIGHLEQQLTQMDRKIDQLLIACSGPETIRLARSIPGFGAKTTPAILAFISAEHLQWGNKRTITRKLQALFGTDPRVKESGRWKGTTKVSKRGIEIARTALFQAAFCAIKFDLQLKQYYDSLKARGKHHKEAMIDLMRKQLARLVCVLVNQKTFTHIPSQV